MDLNLQESHHHHQQQPLVSIFQGNNKILARESSVGQSSGTFHRPAEGVPFKWEMQPGTPKNLQDDEDSIPPICPSPLMQSLGLPLPNLDSDDEASSKTSKIWRLRKMVKKRFKIDNVGGKRSKEKESIKSTFSSPFSISHAPFCCTPWNTPVILEEGNTKIYYCSQHKNAFAVEEDDDLFLSRILYEVSTADHFPGPSNGDVSSTGIPFRWEMHPGTPKMSPENDIIPPPTMIPPPVATERDKVEKSTLKKTWYWIRGIGKKKEREKMMQHEMSFRCDPKMVEEFHGSLRKSSSVSSLPEKRRGGWIGLRIGRGFEGSLWRRDVLVFARRKWKSIAS